jgi:hypothetical protein
MVATIVPHTRRGENLGIRSEFHQRFVWTQESIQRFLHRR